MYSGIGFRMIVVMSVVVILIVMVSIGRWFVIVLFFGDGVRFDGVFLYMGVGFY